MKKWQTIERTVETKVVKTSGCISMSSESIMNQDSNNQGHKDSGKDATSP